MWRSKWILFFSILSIAEINASDDEYLIRTESLPANWNFMPTLGNGHLGYTVFGDSIYMNGIYNGRGGDSHRARIPNWLNLSLSILHCNIGVEVNQFFEMNLRYGYFHWQQSLPTLGLEIKQRTYAHRFFNRGLIYELLVQRTEVKDTLMIKLTQSPGDPSTDFSFAPLGTDGVIANSSTESPKETKRWKTLKAVTTIVENEQFQKQPKTIFIAYSEDLEHGKLIEMAPGERELRYKFILTADENADVAHFEMQSIQRLSDSELLDKHVSIWLNLWQNFSIELDSNLELSRIINAGIFYLASSLPSPNTNQPSNPYYGLSPTGLGRGGLSADYAGHNFWDTETWMLPVVTHLSIDWARELLNYRIQHLPAAQHNARMTGYRGARYPWESAYTGTEVTNPCCPEVATYEIHITPDIALAMKYHFAVTNDAKWLCEEAWPVLREIAEFLESRVMWNSLNKIYHVKNVMGPDEDHSNVNDSVFTNLSFKMSLEFIILVEKICAIGSPRHNWQNIVDNLVILYDAEYNYHPEYDGYKIGEEVKQADVILLGYPLQYWMNDTTRLNDLLNYETVTRKSGPAMTWPMFSVNYLDIGKTQRAELYFEKSYKNYVEKTFKVWSEVESSSTGASNFLTGFGGFFQSIIYGYAGIRINTLKRNSILEIRSRYLLPGTKSFKIRGINFVEATFDLSILGTAHSQLTCSSIGGKKLQLFRGEEKYEIYQGFSIQMENDETIFIQSLID